MKKVIFLLMAFVFSMLTTVAETSVRTSGVIKGPQIESPCVDIGFDQAPMQYRALYPASWLIEQTNAKQPYSLIRVNGNSKTKVQTTYLKKAGTDNEQGLQAIHYNYNLRVCNNYNPIRGDNN